MLKMAGVETHPAVRILIGAVLVVLGLARHSATPALFIGAVLVLWGLVAVVSSGRDRQDAASEQRRDR